MTLLSALLWGCMHPSPPPAGPALSPSATDLDAHALRQQLHQGAFRVREVVQASLDRIELLNRQGPMLRAVIAVAPDALEQADTLDAAESPVGDLHGVPVLIKDNIDAAGMPTTAGSLAMAEHTPFVDAPAVAQLRAAGAVVLGKANLSEWANFRSTQSTSGWSGVGGQCRNPHVLDRTPCGSSSGSAVAVAAGMVPLAVGTETDGSILCPASINGVVGVKPTVGLVSRTGIVPISHSQDTAGPLARTVRDAALLLQAMAAPDPADPATAGRPDGLDTQYVALLESRPLSGARIGVVPPTDDFDARVAELYEAAVRDLEAQGAEVVEVKGMDPTQANAVSEHEWDVLVHEFGPDLAQYMKGVAAISGLDDLVAFNRDHADTELRWFGQEIFELALKPVFDTNEDYLRTRDEIRQITGVQFVDARLKSHQLDALVAITTGPAWPIDPVLGDRYTGGSSTITAISGYPAVTVPMGAVEGLPVGITFLGTAWSEATLLSLAHAYEQATHHRSWPQFRATITPK